MNDAELKAILNDAPDFDNDESSLEPPAPPRQASQVYSVRIPVEKLETLRRIATDRDVAPSSLMRQWVLERLETEVTNSSPPLADSLVQRLIELEQQVHVHQKQLEEQSALHRKEMETVVDRVINVIWERFELHKK